MLYEKHYKVLLFLPMILLVLALAQIGYQIVTTGNIAAESVSLQGGVSVAAPRGSVDFDLFLSDAKKLYPSLDSTMRTLGTGDVVVEVSELSERDALSLLERQGVKSGVATIEVTSGALGKSFFTATLGALGIAFVLMAIVVFIAFRTGIPSLAVLLAGFSTVVITLAIFNLLGEKLTTAGIAAFLMLIGYSVDTDILLSTRALKRSEGSFDDRIISSVKTGLMMTATTFVATTAAFLITNSASIRQIMLIIFIGMLVDIVNTWIQNVGILRLYNERKHGIKH